MGDRMFSLTRAFLLIMQANSDRAEMAAEMHILVMFLNGHGAIYVRERSEQAALGDGALFTTLSGHFTFFIPA